MGQLDDSIKNAIIGNIGTLMTYRVGTSDASFLQSEYSPIFNEQDLLNVPAYTMYVKTIVSSEPIPPFSLDVKKDLNAWNSMMRPAVGNAIKELSALTYGRDRTEVENEIAVRAKL